MTTPTMVDTLREFESRPARVFAARSMAGLAAVLAAGVGFAVVLGLVSVRWEPLVTADVVVARELNQLVAGRPILLRALEILTQLGGSPAAWLLLTTATVWLLVRRAPQLAAYVAVTGLGAAILSPTLKALVGRLRPVVEMPVAFQPGPSFPSGHALGSTVLYGVLLLLFLPLIPRRARRASWLAVTALVATIGFTRIALGVHYLSDVVGGWALGVAWLGVTTSAFRRQPRRPAAPLSSGLEPSSRPALTPAPDARADAPIAGGHAVAQLTVVWVMLLGVLVGTGILVTEVLPAGIDKAVMREVLDLRSPGLNGLSRLASALGSTELILSSALVVLPVTLAVTRRWRPIVFLAVTMLGEVALFLAVGGIIDRPRPEILHLDEGLPPAASFPSGHASAAICWYSAIAVLLAGRARGRRRWALIAIAVLLAGLTAASRIYRGVHYPTDVLGSLLLALPWLAATAVTLRPTGRVDAA